MDKPIHLSIGHDEALVVYEWLSGIETDRISVAVEVALAALVAALERRLVTPFEPRYQDLLAEARARLEAQRPVDP